MTTPAPTPVVRARVTPRIRVMLAGSVAAVAIPGVLVFVLGLFWPPASVLGFAVGGGVAAYALYAALYILRARVEYGDGSYRVREALGDAHLTVDDVALVVPVDELEIPGQASPALIVIGKRRGATPRRLAALNGAAFDTTTLEALASDLKDRGAPLDHITGRVTPAEFDRRHPRVLPLSTLHLRGIRRAVFVALMLLAVVSAVVAALVEGVA